jgi:hypothetical protein
VNSSAVGTTSFGATTRLTRPMASACCTR